MKSICYELRKIDSVVPLYDSEKKAFGVLVEEEWVDIPEDIFHSLFKEKTERTLFELDPYMNSILENEADILINDNPSFIEEVKKWKDIGLPDELLKTTTMEMIKTYTHKSDTRMEYIEIFINKVVDKITEKLK